MRKHPWYRPRTYLHFDCKVGYGTAQKLVTSPRRVAKHAFYPLIGYEIRSQKVTHDTSTGAIVHAEAKPRPIAYAAHLDSHVYSYYAWRLGERYEAELHCRGISDAVIAFRPLGKSNIDFAAAAFDEIRRRGECSALAFDVSKFFDSLDHRLLKKAWAALLGEQALPADHYAVFQSLTHYSKVDRDSLYQVLGISVHNPRNGRRRVCDPRDFREKVRGSGLIKRNAVDTGIPQGTPISALLSNVYMIDFDVNVYGLAIGMGGRYFRYCDDILLIVPSEYADRASAFVETEIKKLKLNINAHKTERRCFKVAEDVQHCDKALQYLGFTYDGQHVLIRSAALARYSARMKRGVRLAKATMRKRNAARRRRNETPKPLFRRKLYARYSHLGRRSFLRYGYRASAITKSRAMRKQLKPLWPRLQDEIKKS